MVNYNKLSASELKEALKKVGMVQSGDKGTLIYRLELYDKCKNNDLKTSNGENPCNLKMAALKVAVAKAGVSPIGTQDELLSALVEYLLLNNTKTSKSGEESATSGSKTSKGEMDGVAIAKAILELEEQDDDEGILNILGPEKTQMIDSRSLTSAMRKNYLKISLLIHPDKIGRQFGQATKAFQALVKAFERMSAAERMAEDAKHSSGKTAKAGVAQLSRSNEGCYRTRVCCPRCKEPWSERDLEGNPEYFYNLLMMGLKRYTCATCLCEFGCVTAIHKCPLCKDRFEYNPNQYHQKVSCLNPECRSNNPKNPKLFGFVMYHTPPKILTDLKEELKASVEATIKSRETKRRRAERAGLGRGRSGVTNSISTVNEKPSTVTGRKSSSISDAIDISLDEEEQAFCLGLIDACPRCGEFLESYSKVNKKDKNELSPQRMHLNQCNDKKAHLKYQLQKEKKLEKEKKKQKLVEKQEDVEGLATWEFLGSKESDMWRLTDQQINMHAHKLGLLTNSDGKMDRFEMLSKIHEHSSANSMENKLLVDNSSSTALVTTTTKQNRTNQSISNREKLIASLPKNLYQSSANQLKSICILHGLFTKKQCETLTKIDFIEEIESVVDGREKHESKAISTDTNSSNKAKDDSTNSMILDKNRSVGREKRKRKCVAILDSDDSDYECDDDGDENY